MRRSGKNQKCSIGRWRGWCGVAIFVGAIAGGCGARPEESAATGAPLHADAPSDEQLRRLGVFDEPLLPVKTSSAEENRALGAALTAYQAAVHARGARDAVAPIVKFLDEHPESPWAPSLLLELGRVYRKTGHFSKALDTWRRAWRASQALDDVNGRTIGDAAVASLSQFEAYLGRKETLAPLLAEITDRPLRGTAAELVSNSKRGLADMLVRPELSFRCGPLAIRSIYLRQHAHGDAEPKIIREIEDTHSTANGLPLTAVRDLSRRLGMDYQMAFRSPGTQVLWPAVAHWKVGHFAAVVGREDGRYAIEDTTFGESIRVDPATLDDEASGYFLVPPGPLPAGWRSVATDEGNEVWGRGDTGTAADPNITGPCDRRAKTGCGGGGGMTTWDVHAMLVSLLLEDVPVGYTPPIGPAVEFGLFYAQRDVQQPMTGFNYFNFGNKWTTSWLSYVTDNGDGTALLYGRGGGGELYRLTSDVSAPGERTLSILSRQSDMSGMTTGFTLQLRDGSVEQFTRSLGNKFFMTAVLDASGNQVVLAYDGLMRLTTITDAIGQVTTLSYDPSSDPVKQLHVVKVTDPFGRAATFDYADGVHLTGITDVLGITSQFSYGAGDFVNTLTTPYGTTTFAIDSHNLDATLDPMVTSVRALVVTDPLGRTSRVEFSHAIQPGDQGAPAPHGMYQIDSQGQFLLWRNTFIWGPEQLAAATRGPKPDYAAATNIHWTHTSDARATSGQIESKKEPLESRVWYTYPGQKAGTFPGAIYGAGHTDLPNGIGRLLSDNTTELEQFDYDAVGNITRTVDAAGRETTFTWATNGLDLLSVSNTTGGGNQTATTMVYDNHHLPISITDASGQTTTASYNAFGQLTKLTDPLGRTITRTYDAQGHLTSIEGPVAGSAWTYRYDSVGRVASATDSYGVTVSYTYDAADRLVQATFPDGTTAKLGYQLLDLASATDRLGQTTQLAYDAGRELTQMTDPLGNQVKLDWCNCGELSAITDPMGNRTTFVRDLQSRIVGSLDASGRGGRIVYDYAAGRVRSVTDALNQTAAYSYNTDGTVAAMSFSGTIHPTAPVSFTYDPSYARVTSMTDEHGTTELLYHPSGALGANQLARMVSPIPGGTGVDVIHFNYDALGRLIWQDVDGATESVQLDEIGRATSINNALDTFNYGYSDATERAARITSGHGPRADLSYLDAKGGGLLGEIKFTGSDGAALADFSYAYDSNEQLSGVTERYVGMKLAGLMGVGHDALAAALTRQLVSEKSAAPDRAGGSRRSSAVAARALAVSWLALLPLFGLLARRRARSWLNGVVLALLVSQLAVGCSNPAATMDDAAPPPPEQQGPALVTSYAYDAASRLIAATTTPTNASANAAPTQKFAYSYDASSNLTSLTGHGATAPVTYDTLNQITGPIPARYDSNGSPTILGDAEYAWDGANRLISIKKQNDESDFSYDGTSHLVRIVEQHAGKVVADRAYLWCGASRCLERDNLQPGSPITKRYFGDGVQIAGQSYYYVADHLGSVRQLVDASGKVRAQYDYDPYGNATKLGGDLDSDITYAGYFHHAPSGLYLAMFRCYSSQLGRWLNRDPLGEEGGLNLYGYMSGDPINGTDPLGLKDKLDRAMEAFNNGVAGFADTVSWGATTHVRKWIYGDDWVDPCSKSYLVGEVAGVIHGLLMGAAHLGRNVVNQMAKQGSTLTRLTRGLGRLFKDPRKWGSVRSTWSKAMGSGTAALKNAGMELHHWFMPQRWGVAQGGPIPTRFINAGLNYLAISRGLNNYMNGSTRMRLVVEWAFKGAVIMTEGSPVATAVRKHGGTPCP